MFTGAAGKLAWRLAGAYGGFPRPFWVLMGGTLIDRVGAALAFPFLSLYMTQHFHVGVTEVGTMFLLYAIANAGSGLVAGALTDRFGRKVMIVAGLLAAALNSALACVVNDIRVFYAVAAIIGSLADMGGPARQAIIADVLPPEKTADGYGVWRVVENLAAGIGPILGGLMVAGAGFVTLFALDSITSLVMAGIVIAGLPETKPTQAGAAPRETLREALLGYRRVATNRLFMIFLAIVLGIQMVHIQMFTSLSIFLVNQRGVAPGLFGLIFGLNAVMVVLFQLPVTRRLARRPPMLMIALGAALYAVGFALYGVVTAFGLMLAAMAVITLGEMVRVPVQMAIAASLAPDDMRGRYIAAMNLTWVVPYAIGPLAAGAVMDHGDPNWVWFGSGILSVVCAAGAVLLHLKEAGRFSAGSEPAPAGELAPAALD